MAGLSRGAGGGGLSSGHHSSPRIQPLGRVCSMSNPTPISWQDVEDASAKDEVIPALNKLIIAGTPDKKDLWPDALSEYHRHRDHLSTIGPVVLYKGRAVLPASLRKEALEVLHSAHQGVTSMVSRAGPAVFWPCMQEDIIRTRQACTSCDQNSPSQPAAPPKQLPSPTYPFEMIASDYFSHAGKQFLIVVDRYSGWLSVYQAGPNGAESLIKELKTHFTTFGISSELASDGAGEYVAGKTQKFLKNWKVNFRLSSAYFPHSNQRAELGVRAAKRMLRENLSASGNLDTDRFLRALLTYRNTPDRDTGKSPAQVVFGHPIKDFFPVHPQNFQPRPEWLLTAQQREVALARRHTRQGAILAEHTKVLKPLQMLDIVLVQNQAGRRGKKWDRSGVVVEILDHDQYRIKVDGSGRTTLRNRRFLRPITPFNNPPNMDQYTALPLSQAGQAAHVQPGEAVRDQPVQPGGAVHDQPAQLEDTVQPLPSDREPPSPAPAEPVLTPAPSSAPPRRSPATSTTASSEPAVRKSGRTRVTNTRLMGYELGSLTLCRRGGRGGGR